MNNGSQWSAVAHGMRPPCDQNKTAIQNSTYDFKGLKISFLGLKILRFQQWAVPVQVRPRAPLSNQITHLHNLPKKFLEGISVSIWRNLDHAGAARETTVRPLFHFQNQSSAWIRAHSFITDGITDHSKALHESLKTTSGLGVSSWTTYLSRLTSWMISIQGQILKSITG